MLYEVFPVGCLENEREHVLQVHHLLMSEREVPIACCSKPSLHGKCCHEALQYIICNGSHIIDILYSIVIFFLMVTGQKPVQTNL